METQDIIFTAVLLLILAEVSVLLARLPRSSLSKKGRSMLIDTSVLIDGRFVAIAQSGFVSDTVVIPRSVVGELQFLADNGDSEKRTRARHGLDVIKELQQISHLDVKILQDGTRSKTGVDDRLLELAKQYKAVLCTIDYNLNKVALVEGIQVLNVNELAQNLRMAHLPGEKVLLEISQKGQDKHQGVGHLGDGTMVVVENAFSSIGSTVEIEVIRSLQTAAGKMMFAKIVGGQTTSQSPKKTPKASTKPPQTKAPQSTQSPQTTNAKPVHSNKPANHSKPSKSNNQSQNNNNKSRRPRRDQEANLIDLVEKSNQ